MGYESNALRTGPKESRSPLSLLFLPFPSPSCGFILKCVSSGSILVACRLYHVFPVRSGQIDSKAYVAFRVSFS